MPASPPPPPPPPPSTPPPPPPPSRAAAADALARGTETFNAAVGRLGERSAQLGLDVEGAGASVWPVLGVGAMLIALLVDRLKDVHTVPVRWLVVLGLLGALVVAAEIRRGGKLPVLERLPAWATTTGLRLAMLLVLVAQLTNYLSVGIVQILWWVATVLVAVPVLRAHQAVREFRLAGRVVTPEIVGAAAVALAIVVGVLPQQGDVGLVWSIVGGAAAAATCAAATRSFPYADGARDIAALLVAGIAVRAASLTVVGLLWIAAAWLLASARWRTTAAVAARPAWRSGAGLAIAGCFVAALALFGTFDSFSSAGGYTGGYTYSYDYGYDSSTGEYGYGYGYNYSPTAYYDPGFFWATSGRGQSGAPIVVAGLLALAAFARRGGSRVGRVTYVAGAVAVGALVWVAVVGSLHYFPVWVAAAGAAVTIGWLGRAVWQARLTPAPAAAAPPAAGS